MSTAAVAGCALGFIEACSAQLGSRSSDLAPAARLTVAAALAADLATPSLPAAARALEASRAAARRAVRRWRGGVAGRPGLHWLLAAAVERRNGGALPHLEDYTALVAEVLGDDPSPATLPTRLALALAGENVARTEPKDATVDLEAADLLGSATALDLACERIEVATRFGLRLAAAAPGLDRVLAVGLYCALQDYRLIAASRLLRSIAYLGGDRVAVADGREFLVNQQQEDGGIGFLDRETALAEERSPGRGALELRIETTLSALWALAESGGGGYRLFRDLGCRGAAERPIRQLNRRLAGARS